MIMSGIHTITGRYISTYNNLIFIPVSFKISQAGSLLIVYTVK